MKTPFIVALGVTSLFAAEDPFARDPTQPQPGSAEPGRPRVISMNYEVYSLPMDQAAALQRTVSGDEGFYKELVARTATGEGKLESIAAVRCVSGQRAEAKGAAGQSYPTEYLGKVAKKPAEREQGAEIDPRTSHSDVTPPLPNAFESRECGTKILVEPTAYEKGLVVEITIEASHVTLTERLKWGRGLSQVEMPVFESQKLDTSIWTFAGQPCFLGTISRPPGSKAIEASPKRVWFAFLTVDFVKN